MPLVGLAEVYDGLQRAHTGVIVVVNRSEVTIYNRDSVKTMPATPAVVSVKWTGLPKAQSEGAAHEVALSLVEENAFTGGGRRDDRSH